MTTSQGTQNQQYQSVSQPWMPTQAPLTGITNNVGGYNYAPTQAQTNAANAGVSAAGGIPNYGPTVGNTANNYLNGQMNAPVQQAANQASSALQPYLSSNYLDPMTNPYLAPAIQAQTNQTLNTVNGQMAAAGRSGSPANATAAAYGVTQAIDPMLMGQYNTNVQQQQAAAGMLPNIANAANQQYGANTTLGLQAAGSVPSYYMAPSQAQMGAAQNQYQMPLSNVSGVENLLLPIAGLGGQTSGNQQTQTSQTMSPEQAALLGIQPFGGANSPVSGFGNFMSAFNPMPNMNWGGY